MFFKKFFLYQIITGLELGVVVQDGGGGVRAEDGVRVVVENEEFVGEFEK
jgi:hypothetical protein